MIKCVCEKLFEEKEFKEHFKKCEKLIAKYKDIDYQISQLIKSYINSKESLIIIKFMFKRYIKVFEYKLKNLFNLDSKETNIKTIETNIKKPKTIINKRIVSKESNIISNEEKKQIKIEEKNLNLINNLKNKPSSNDINDNILKNFKFKKIIIKDSSNQNKFKCYHGYKACIFSFSKDTNIYIVYGDKNTNLKCYDMKDDKDFILFKNFNNIINICRYFYDNDNKRDLLITCCFSNNNVKIINFNKEKSIILFELNFEKEKSIINTNYFLNGQIIIPFSHEEFGKIKFFNMKSENIHEIKKNVGYIYCINSHFWKKRNINYIFITNSKGIFIYDMKSYLLIKKLIVTKKENYFYEPCIIEKDENLIVIDFNYLSKNLYFWDFEKGYIISVMPLESGISNILLLNNDYIFVSIYNGKTKLNLININKKKIENEIYLYDNNEDAYWIRLLRNKNIDTYLLSISEKI